MGLIRCSVMRTDEARLALLMPCPLRGRFGHATPSVALVTPLTPSPGGGGFYQISGGGLSDTATRCRVPRQTTPTHPLSVPATCSCFVGCPAAFENTVLSRRAVRWLAFSFTCRVHNAARALCEIVTTCSCTVSVYPCIRNSTSNQSSQQCTYVESEVFVIPYSMCSVTVYGFHESTFHFTKIIYEFIHLSTRRTEPYYFTAHAAGLHFSLHPLPRCPSASRSRLP